MRLSWKLLQRIAIAVVLLAHGVAGHAQQPDQQYQVPLNAGFYVIEVTLGTGEREGSWGLEVLTSGAALTGGFNLGGGFDSVGSQRTGFAGFNLGTAQFVSVDLAAQALPGANGPALTVHILDSSRTQVSSTFSGSPPIRFGQNLPAGFYIIEASSLAGRGTYQLGLGAQSFAGGIDVGGFITGGLTGFGGLYLPNSQTVTIKLYSLAYGSLGAGKLKVRVRDQNGQTAWIPSSNDVIYAATSYTGSTLPAFDITSGSPVNFATLNAGGWMGPLASPDGVRIFAVTNSFTGSLWDITAGGDMTAAKPFASGLFPRNAGYLEGLAFDAAGNAYVTNSESGSQPIAKVAPNGSISYLSGHSGLFNNATGLVVQNRTLYIAEGGTGKVLAYDLSTDSITDFATGFTPAVNHFSGQLTIDPRGKILLLWSAGAGSGLFDISSGGSFAGRAPLLSAPFSIDVNQIAADSANNVYAAGDGSGNVYISRFSNGAFVPFSVFTGGLGDVESVVVLRPQTTGEGATFSLTVAKAGTGGGTVTSSPAGINCGSTCTANFNSGTSVALTATPSANSTFAGWSGACTNVSGPCTVTMDQSRSVTATFSQSAVGGGG